MKNTFKKAERLKSSIEIGSLLSEGHFFTAYPFKIFWKTVPGPAGSFPAKTAFLVPKKKFKKDGKWHTWIDFEKFNELINSEKEFSTEDFLKETHRGPFMRICRKFHFVPFYQNSSRFEYKERFNNFIKVHLKGSGLIW